MIAPALRATEINPGKLGFLFRRQFEMSKVCAGETIVLVSDLATRREYIEAAFAASDELGADVYEMRVNSIPSWTKVGVPTIGKCKGTLDAVKAADLLVIFHVPLFTRWLKEVMDSGTRVLMIIDAPDDLEQLLSPPGLKEAVKYAEALYSRTREVRVMSEARWYSLALNGEEPERHRAGARVFAGNFLFSTGPNSQGGGKRTTRGHYDVPMRDCTVMLDGKVIIDKGRIVDPAMQVKRVSIT